MTIKNVTSVYQKRELYIDVAYVNAVIERSSTQRASLLQ